MAKLAGGAVGAGAGPAPPPRLVAAILSGGRSAAAAALLRQLAAADDVVVVCGDEDAARRWKEAGVEVLAGTVTEAAVAALPPRVLERAAGGWLLVLQDDELMSTELRREVGERLRNAAPGVAALTVTVTRHVLGRYLRHGGWRTREARLFRVPLAPPGSLGAALEEACTRPGAVESLRGVLVSLGERTLDGLVDRLDRRADRTAAAAAAWSPGRLLVESGRECARRLVIEQGCRDGVRGLIAAVFSAVEPFVALAKRRDPGRAPAGSGGSGARTA
jgi:hypothetical protein